MKYFKPEEVKSPQDFISSVTEIYDGGKDSFSLAKVVWEGEDCLAIRWNVARREWDSKEKINGEKKCVGLPSSHGYPIWFILPKEIVDRNSDVWKKIDKIL